MSNLASKVQMATIKKFTQKGKVDVESYFTETAVSVLEQLATVVLAEQDTGLEKGLGVDSLMKRVSTLSSETLG